MHHWESAYRAWAQRINADGTFKMPPVPPGPPPHPVDGLTGARLRRATRARLILDSFGADGPKYRNQVSFNGVECGELPPSNGDQWTAKTALELPAAVISTLRKSNQLIIRNLDRDAFKIRNVYIELILASGELASSNLLAGPYCSTPRWTHAEGERVPAGESITLSVTVPGAD